MSSASSCSPSLSGSGVARTTAGQRRVASATHRFPGLTSGAREGLLVPHADTIRVLVALLDGRDHRGVDWDAFATWPNGAIVTHNWPRPA